MPNRLAGETSPYLLQHKDNPIDWYPWGDEAFEKAEREQKPVMLSVGYSSCHWCHVMAHESFESSEVAKLLNEHFVSIKVDREERPDVDEAYMAAVHLSNGRGGWPMTVFLMPDKRPFFAGTYFPKHDRGQHPGLISILRRIAEGWAEQRSEFASVAEQYDSALKGLLTREAPAVGSGSLQELLRRTVETLVAEADLEHGGFGTRPKFPPHTAVEFLLQFAECGPERDGDDSLRGSALAVALHALDRMAMGGIHDHVGGGFHRYSTDERWLLPHFEKMLYDNALLLGNYATAFKLVEEADPAFARTARGAARGIVDWLGREMTSSNGLFYSALDADSEGEEGRFYVWTEAEVREILGGDAEAFLGAYGFAEGGNFADEATGRRTGANIPHVAEELSGAFEGSLVKLLSARAARVLPMTDTKALVGWNGLAVAALAVAGETGKAVKAANAVLGGESAAGELPRQVTDGKPAGSAFLEDYAYFTFGLLELGRATGDPRWRLEAERLGLQMVERFWDEAGGGFYATASAHEELFGRTKPVFDQPIPSANAVAIRCLVRLGDYDRARTALNALKGWIESAPQSCEGLVLAALEFSLEAGDWDFAIPRDVDASLAEGRLKAGADGWAAGEVVLSIPEGLHVNPYEPVAKWLVRTEVRISPLENRVLYPESSVEGYTGKTVIPFRVRVPEGEAGAEFEVTVRYQACTEAECLEPVEKRLPAIVGR
jgi:uncharacterized protein YyaL (SSP411 family)